MDTVVADADDEPRPDDDPDDVGDAVDGTNAEEGVASRLRRALTGWFGLVLLAMALACVAIWQANADGSWKPPFFFDEVWRVDFIRSSHPIERMYAHDTPIPLGWVLGMHAITSPLPYKPALFRIISVGWFLLGVAVLTFLFVRIAQRSPRGPSWLDRVFDRRGSVRPMWLTQRTAAAIPVIAAPIGVALVCFIPRVSHYFQYFNNYTFEIAYVAVLVLAAEELDRTPRWAFPGLCALIALSPLFVLGGMFAIPALVVGAGWWAWRSLPDLRRRRLVVLAGSCVATAVIGAIEWVKVYKPVAGKPSISKFWIDEKAALGGDVGLWDLLTKTVQQTSSGMIGDRAFFVGAVLNGDSFDPVTGPVQIFAYLLLTVAIVVGMVAVWRRWPWLIGVIVSSWMLTIVASAVTHWPMTLERVNLCWQIFFFVIAGFGLARTVLWFTPKHPSFALPAFALVFAALWFPPFPVGLNAFSRNLTYDLEVVGNSPGKRNIVFQYHTLAHFYADNDLINTPRGDRTFEIVPETTDPSSEWMFQPLDGFLRDRQVKSGDVIWCVMPLEMGEKTFEACQFADPSKLELVGPEHNGQGAKIRGFRVR